MLSQSKVKYISLNQKARVQLNAGHVFGGLSYRSDGSYRSSFHEVGSEALMGEDFSPNSGSVCQPDSGISYI